MPTHPRHHANGALPYDAGLVCKMADRFEDYDAAFRLVYERYLESGLIEDNPYQRRVLRHHFYPGTNTFIAYRRGLAVCTTTLIGDSEHGIPLDALYPAEIDRKRRRGLRLAEVSSLAGVAGSRRSFHQLFMRLMRILGQHSCRFGIDQLVVAVHPKHARYYQRTMGFRKFGEEIPYRALHDAPAVAIALDFKEVHLTRPPAYELIFGRPLALADLLPRPMAPELVRHFGPMVDSTEMCVPLSF